MKYHFIENKVAEGVVKLVKIDTAENLSDMRAKVVTLAKFKHCLDLLINFSCGY